MEIFTTLIRFLGIGINIGGALFIAEGWQTYAAGKSSNSPNERLQGQNSMIYGGMMIAGGTIVMTYVANQIAALG